MPKLMLGGGDQTVHYQRRGWLVLDGDPEVGADFVARVPPLPDEIKDIEWSIVKAVHFIEHLYRDDAVKLLAEIYDILAPGGSLILEQGNLEWVCKAILGQVELPTSRYPWMNGDSRWLHIWNLYPQPHQVKGNNLQRHRYGWTPADLQAAAIEAGFSAMKTGCGAATSHVPERDFRLEAVK